MPLLIELQYLPSTQYFAKLLRHEEVLLEQKEHYRKGSYRNRCYIAGANGVLMLSIPLVKGKNEQQDIRQTRISEEDSSWRNQHWRTIQSAYGNSPFFEYYGDELKAFYQKKYEYLWDFNYDLLLWITKKLQLDVSITLTAEYQAAPSGDTADWRNAIHPKQHKQRADEHFKAAYYPQAFEDRHGFLSNLSILDLLFCSGPGAGLILESCIVE
jgi:hypothetical protein